MKKYYIYHNTNGIADQYLLTRKSDHIVVWIMPKLIGRWLYWRKKK